MLAVVGAASASGVEICDFVGRLRGRIPEESTTVAKGSLCNGSYRGTTLSLFGKNLAGTLPSELCQLTRLTFLGVGDEQIHGTIPDCLGQLTNLETLLLDRNKLSGTIPEGLSQLTALKGLYLRGMPLEGTVPAGLTELPNLSQCDLKGSGRYACPLPTGANDVCIKGLECSESEKVEL